jgi:hypothetical protein
VMRTAACFHSDQARCTVRKVLRGLVCPRDKSRILEGYGFVRANRARLPIATMARLLGVSTSGFYVWLVREPSTQSRSDAQRLARIRTLHASSRGTNGAPRIHAHLAREGVHVGRKRGARLMRRALSTCRG